MKNSLLLTLSFLLGLAGFAQQSAYLFDNTPTQILTLRNTPEGYTGSPYVEKDFVQGFVVDENGKTQQAFLRYNTIEDVVEVKLNRADEKTVVLPKVKNLSYRLKGYTYVLDDLQGESERMEGYFILYHDGDKVKFYGRPLPELTPASLAKTGYEKDKPAHLDVKTDYFISVNGGKLKSIKLKEKDLEEALPSSKEVKKYFSDNKVKSVEDIQEMLNWYEKQNL